MNFDLVNLHNINLKPSFNLARTKVVAGGKLNQPDPVADKLVAGLEKDFGNKLFVPIQAQAQAFQTAPGGVALNVFLQDSLDNIVAGFQAQGLNPQGLSLRDVILQEGLTAKLFSVKNLIKEQAPGFNSSYLLQHENLFDFLFRTAVAKGFQEEEAIAQFMLETDDGGGTKLLYDYLAEKAVDDIVQTDHLVVAQAQTDSIKDQLKKAPISFARGVFSERIRKELNAAVFSGTEIGLIEGVSQNLNLNIRPDEYPALVNYIKTSNGAVNPQSANYLIPLALTRLRSNEFNVTTTATSPIGDSDFSVTYYEDAQAALVVNRENILCAAQIFYVMTLADEMELFNVANRIVTKHFNSVGIKIPSKESHNMLKLYLFGDSFKDSKDGNIYKRTVPQERWLVYKALFNAGEAQILEGMTVNAEFNEHWEVLMSEVVKYLDKAQLSENPEYFVSRQNIMQAIEDLQYNLSSFCTTMAKIAGPVINAELDFVMKEILQNPEITLRLAPDGSNSVWKVVEHELSAMRQGWAPNVKALYDKARYGDAIIRAIANYSPNQFDQTFSDFVGLVEAFIIASSKLERTQEERSSLFPDELEEAPGMDGYGGGNGMYERSPNGSTNGSGSKDDWNF